MNWKTVVIIVLLLVVLWMASGYLIKLFKEWYNKSRFGEYCVKGLPVVVQHELYDICNLSSYGLTLDDVKVKTYYDGEYCHVKIYLQNVLVEEFESNYMGGYPLYCSKIIQRWSSQSK